MESLRDEYTKWAEEQEKEYRERYSDRYPACHPDWLAVRIPQRFNPLFSELESEIISQGNYLTPGIWFFPDSGDVLRLSYQN